MKAQFIVLILLTLLVFSCDEEEVVPRTNPRFSVTMVQDISEGGAEFRAQINDYGTDEILEYGFVYSEYNNPRIGYGDFVSGTGRPQDYFTLKTTHGLIKGRNYYVTAYLKTSNGIVYSEPSQFISQGSEGFVLDRIEYRQPLYYGDTLVVFGDNLSSNPAYYDVTVNGTSALVSGLSKNGFKVKIPTWMQMERVDEQRVLLDIHMTVAGKNLDFKEIVNFREPEFSVEPIQKVFYREEVTIKGRYLHSDVVKVKMKNTNGGGWEMPVTNFNENEISFLAEMGNYIFENGSLVVSIRGKDYPMSDLFTMKGSELEPGQKFTGNSNSYFEVKGSHFIEDYQANEFLTNIPGVNAYSHYVSGDLVGLNFDGAILSRDLKIYANNYGQKSENFAEFHFTDGHLNFLKMPSEFLEYQFNEESGVTMDGNGYFFRKRNVYKIDPKTREMKVVAKAPESVFHLSGGFSYGAINGKIYLGAISSSSTQKSFWEFDPKTNQFKQLADIPSKAIKPKLVYATQTHLYYEGGYTYGSGGYTWDPGVYRYSFASNKWEKLAREFENDEYTVLFKTFRYKGDIYTVLDVTTSLYPELWKFNESTQNWEVIKQLGHYERVTTANELFVIGDWVYTFNNQTITAFHMQTFENKTWNVGYSLSSFSMNYSFQADGKIYGQDYNYLVEFDPEYFSD